MRRGRPLCLAIFLVSLLVCYADKSGRDNLERCVSMAENPDDSSSGLTMSPIKQSQLFI